MKAKNVGGRESFLENARTACVVLSEEERAVIEDKKGDQSISEFIRDSIKLRGALSDNLLIQEIRELKDETLKMERELDSFRQKEAIVAKMQTETLADLGVAYMNYLKQTHPTEHYRNNWIDGRCKSAGISSIEFLVYVDNQEAINNVQSEACRET